MARKRMRRLSVARKSVESAVSRRVSTMWTKISTTTGSPEPKGGRLRARLTRMLRASKILSSMRNSSRLGQQLRSKPKALTIRSALTAKTFTLSWIWVSSKLYMELRKMSHSKKKLNAILAMAQKKLRVLTVVNATLVKAKVSRKIPSFIKRRSAIHAMVMVLWSRIHASKI